MFIGSIDTDSRIAVEQVLHSIDKVKHPNIYVGCSGNFTFDRIASFYGFGVYSNDVSLYSRLIAAIVQNEKFSVTCTNDELYNIVQTWDDTPYTTLIQVMFAMRYGQFVAQKNDYQCMMCENYRNGAQQFFQNTLKQFQKKQCFDFKINNFFFGDFKKHLASAKQEDTIFLYAPTYKGGYEKLYKYVEESFGYDHPSYDIFDSSQAGTYYKELLETKRVCIYSDLLYEEIQKYVVGRVDKKEGKRSVYFYTNIVDSTFYLKPSVRILSKIPEILTINDTVTDETILAVTEIPLKVVNHYKHLFMSSRVNYSQGGDFALGFFVDKKLFGFAVFSKILGTKNSFETLFLHSDFVVESSIERLSKLLLYLLRSADVAKLIRRHYFFDYKGLQTSVYTDKPVSMKYRGVFKKEECNETNKLVYTCQFTDLPIQECYKKWKSRKNLNQ
jgi:hypothetical protein